MLGQDVKIYLLIVHIQLSDLPESRLKLWEHVSLEWTVYSFCQNILFLDCVASVADVDNDHVSCISLHPANATASLVLIPVQALVSWCQKCRPGLSHTFKLKVEYVYNRPLSLASQQQVPYPAQWRIIETYLPHFILVHLSALSS